MTKRMLIDASHGEETRVVVLDGNRLEDFDVETATKKQLKGNIYLAKVVRVEPSLQAAFVEYGGNRHGFLAFAEIHPDYYQIPVADRQRLLEMQEAEAREEEAAEDAAAAADEAAGGDLVGGSSHSGGRAVREVPISAAAPLLVDQATRFGDAEPPAETGMDAVAESPAEAAARDDLPTELGSDETMAAAVEAPLKVVPAEPSSEAGEAAGETSAEPLVASGTGSGGLPDLDDGPVGPDDGSLPGAGTEVLPDIAPDTLPADREGEESLPPGSPDRGFVEGTDPESGEPASLAPDDQGTSDQGAAQAPVEDDHQASDAERAESDNLAESRGATARQDGLAEAEDQAGEAPEPAGGDADDAKQRRQYARHLRSYKIQEVIRRRQILLVQVVKEERGTKGAALTTYISLAGRFSVLMPNSPRGGGISRKITAAADRRRLKEITAELQLPRGMGIIVRTAGAQRPKPEIRRDCEYLLRLWDEIRDTTMASMAPALIHEEASLIKRSIRDVYSNTVDEILVDGEDGWRAARDFMRMLMPAHASKVQLWRDPAGQPLFARQQVEAQLDAMLSPNVQLRSGGYLVINQTEALVAIDVNSGRSTRERGIEETALRTNLEAADEVARQLRLRDLAGLIVIDFIDMESRRNNTAVERRIADALKTDRARIQIGHISSFGLLEMSRQRLRPSLAETSFVACPHCAGTGLVRSTESAALHILRGVEEEAGRRRAASITVHVAAGHAVYLLNHKRAEVGAIEHRCGVAVCFEMDDALPTGTLLRIERSGTYVAPALPYVPGAAPADEFGDEPAEAEAEAEAEAAATLPARMQTGTQTGTQMGAMETAEAGVKRRRRRRGRKREEGGVEQAEAADDEAGDVEAGVIETGATETGAGLIGMHAGALSEAPEMGLALGAQPEAAAIVPTETAAMTTEASEAGASEAAAGDEDAPKRRRGRRGGRRKPREEDGTAEPAGEAPLAYVGPTPADPFAGQGFDVFDAIEQAEQREAMLARAPQPSPAAPLATEIETETAGITPQAELAPVAVTPASISPDTAAPAHHSASVAEVEASYADPLAAEAARGEAPASKEEEPAAAQPEQAVPEQVAAEAAPAPRPELQPMLIGDLPQTEKKRGWWRR